MRNNFQQFLALVSVLFVSVASIVLAAKSSSAPATSQPSRARASDKEQSGESFAVVELFTSEGCSSCPAADTLLSEMAATSRKSGLRVFPLAFHVNYFDGPRWKDRFGDASFSQRQRDYSAALKLDNVYTPQMIVNGANQFVGSDRAAAKSAVDAALATPATATVSMKVESQSMDGNSYRVSYAVVGPSKHSVVNVAVVERGLKSNVSGGENGGRVLSHDNVVRWFRSVANSADGKGEIAVPRLEGVDLKNASIIVYVQEIGNGAVLGVTASDF